MRSSTCVTLENMFKLTKECTESAHWDEIIETAVVSPTDCKEKITINSEAVKSLEECKNNWQVMNSEGNNKFSSLDRSYLCCKPNETSPTDVKTTNTGPSLTK